MSVVTPGLKKRSITIPSVTEEGVKARVGERGFSAYVAAAVARQLERDALAEAIARTQDAHGPVDEAEVEALLEHLGR